MPDPKFTLYVDESGDLDLDRFRNEERDRGSDPYLVFGAVLVANKHKAEIRTELENIRSAIGCNELHCANLNHLKTAYFARRAKGLRFLAFGVVSKKETVGDYKSLITGSKQAEDYYNKCAHYLLERVGSFMSVHGYRSDQLSIVFEDRKHDYERMRRYLRRIIQSPIDSRAASLANINPNSVISAEKGADEILALADLISYSLYQIVNETKTNFGIPEQRYFREIKNKFWFDSSSGQIANHGIKFIKGPVAMGLRDETMKLVMKLYRKSS